jgi:prepilin-type N-terminal cleavage/methylation domain-containing protein
MFTAIAAPRTNEHGMTIIELLTVMVIIGILSGLSLTIIDSYRYNGRDNERISDVESIARSFEISYLRDATSNGPSYPTAQRATDTANYASLFKGQGLDATKAPDTTSATSIVAATSNAQPQSPTKNQYIYQPLTANGALCNSTDLCVRFIMYYRLEATNTVQSVESIHQQ